MTERVNRRDLILQKTADLFVEQGYSSTSIRQIAEAVGCTEAAIYYHFKDGKRELLQSVVECEAPDVFAAVESVKNAQSLSEFIVGMGEEFNHFGREKIERMRWLLADLPQMSQEEREFVQTKHLGFHQAIALGIRPFVESDKDANRIARLILSAVLGYGVIFWMMGMEQHIDYAVTDFIEDVACLFE